MCDWNENEKLNTGLLKETFKYYKMFANKKKIDANVDYDTDFYLLLCFVIYTTDPPIVCRLAHDLCVLYDTRNATPVADMCNTATKLRLMSVRIKRKTKKNVRNCNNE